MRKKFTNRQMQLFNEFVHLLKEKFHLTLDDLHEGHKIVFANDEEVGKELKRIKELYDLEDYSEKKKDHLLL